MATITIRIETDNAAFNDQPLGFETQRILKTLATTLSRIRDGHKLRDMNGNTVGSVQIED